MSRPGRFHGWIAAVTGASSGLGAEFARQLAPRLGAHGHLVLAARRRDLLDALAAELRAAHPGLGVEVEAVDLRKPEEAAPFAARLRDRGVDLLVNNAGLGDLGLFEAADWERDEAMLRVNVEALTLLAKETVPGMVARKRGAVVNVGSTAGYLPLPTFAVYAATKAYVNSFSEALHWELHGTGVTVTAVCPGPVPTGFADVAARPGGLRAMQSPSLIQIPARQAVAEALDAAEKGKPRVVTGEAMKFAVLLMSLLPLPLLRLIYRFQVPKTVARQRREAKG